MNIHFQFPYALKMLMAVSSHEVSQVTDSHSPESASVLVPNEFLPKIIAQIPSDDLETVRFGPTIGYSSYVHVPEL